jgi:hypothetical protein
LKVFLGGTCNESTWRESLIPLLTIDFFNPVVPDWTPECMDEEIRQRRICDYVLYVITPRMTGVYSIAEAVDDSNKRPQKTIFCILQEDIPYTFASHQLKSLNQTSKLIMGNGAKCFNSLEETARFLNRTPQASHCTLSL